MRVRTTGVEQASAFAQTPYARFLYAEDSLPRLEQYLAEAMSAFQEKNDIQIKQHVLQLKIEAIGCRRALNDFSKLTYLDALIDATEKIILNHLLVECHKSTMIVFWAVCQDELVRCSAALRYISKELSLLIAQREWVKRTPPHPIKKRFY